MQTVARRPRLRPRGQKRPTTNGKRTRTEQHATGRPIGIEPLGGGYTHTKWLVRSAAPGGHPGHFMITAPLAQNG